ncbi:MAG: NADH-quinone oxidoreductase subunit C [Nitrococcus mobilis]|nr:NADH-quinone oxidoreductase subunit C [Nitrococcus mobilis]
MSTCEDLLGTIGEHGAGIRTLDAGDRHLLEVTTQTLPKLAVDLTSRLRYEFATLVVDPGPDCSHTIHYFFYCPADATLVELVTGIKAGVSPPAISDQVHAADWYEREAEDMYGIHFAGHPFLGDFVLHDTEWPENVAPMRVDFDPGMRVQEPGLGERWHPRRLLSEEGALIFPVGPIWSDYAEAGLWLLETPGEQIRQAHSRLFYKYRGVEKIAEGQSPQRALLLAERFSGNSAFAHALAYCQALEKLAGSQIPARAEGLRVVFAELERIRYHAATIAELAGSTALLVGKSMGQEIEEDLLRLSGAVAGHRYLFGLVVPGGLAWEPQEKALRELEQGVAAAGARLGELEQLLVHSSSFLDRIEEMGTLTPELAASYGVVGPIARASGRALDLRRALPYGGYAGAECTVPCETEGDGYARLRVFFAEVRASVALIRATLAKLPEGPSSVPCEPQSGTALAWSEAPAGGAFHWVRLGADARIARWHIGTPGFRNWHAFHRAVEGVAFQDFPIILASFGLTVAENDL